MIEYVGIVSDSHGMFGGMQVMVDRSPQVSVWIHGGDYCEDGDDLAVYAGVPVYAVRGNNDYWNHQCPDSRVVTVGGVSITAIHGHQWYSGRLSHLSALGKKNHSSLVVFGHTHRMCLEEVEGITIVNPGSISLPRDSKKGTYAVCAIENSHIKDVKLYHV